MKRFSFVPVCPAIQTWSPIAIKSEPDPPKRQDRSTGLSAHRLYRYLPNARTSFANLSRATPAGSGA
jgi:hypothetical protein